MHKSLVKKPRQSLIPSSLLSTSMSAEERSAKTAAVQTTQRNTLKPRCPMTQVSREKEPNQLQYSMMACVSAQVWPGCPVTPFNAFEVQALSLLSANPTQPTPISLRLKHGVLQPSPWKRRSLELLRPAL